MTILKGLWFYNGNCFTRIRRDETTAPGQACIGIHVGEVAIDANNDDNLTIKTARELCSLAGVNQVLVSRTITDLVAGSGIEIDGYGTVRLKSLDRDWELFHVKTASV